MTEVEDDLERRLHSLSLTERTYYPQTSLSSYNNQLKLQYIKPVIDRSLYITLSRLVELIEHQE